MAETGDEGCRMREHVARQEEIWGEMRERKRGVRERRGQEIHLKE